MEAALATINGGIDLLAAADLALLAVEDVGLGVLALQAVEDRVRVLKAVWLGEFDSRRGWAPSGHRDAAGWLAARGKTSVVSAKKAAALGKALDASPALADAVTSGSISPDTADALLPTLASNHSGDVADLVDACKGATPVEARAAGSSFREMNPPVDTTAADREDELRKKRYLRFSDNGDGTSKVDGCLTSIDRRTVEEALKGVAGKPGVFDDRTHEQRLADALVQLCQAQLRGEVKGGRSSLPTILVTIDINDLNGNTNGPGYTSKGDVIPAEAVRKMCTNANIARILLNGSQPLDLGRSERLASNDQWRALLARDGGCRFTDCTMPAEWCEVDHIQEWDAEHGPTDLDLLVLLCLYHHHFRHRPGVHLIGDGNNLSVQLPDGSIVPLPPRGPTHRHKPGDGQGDLFNNTAA